MICENCGIDSNSGIVYKKHIFCSHKCRDEYYEKKKELLKKQIYFFKIYLIIFLNLCPILLYKNIE